MARNSMTWLIQYLRLKINDEGPASLESDQYYLGDSIKLTCTYKDDNGIVTDPTSPTVNIWNPQGMRIVDSVVPTKSGIGIYSYTYRIPESGPEGVWRAEFTGAIGSTVSEYPVEFEAVIARRIWTDDELQNYLDMHRIHIHRELLHRDALGKIYSSQYSMFENDICLWDGDGAYANSVIPDDSNLVDGIFEFNTYRDVPYYLDGNSYNIHAAIAECLEQLAIDPNKAKEWSRGRIKYTHYDLMEMAKYHRNLAGPSSLPIARIYRK